MTENERLMLLKMIGDLESQVVDLVAKLGPNREWSLAVTKMEECAMWMRKAVERMISDNPA